MASPDIHQTADSSPGTIADRALSLAASFWRPVLALALLTYIPQAILHFNTATAWVNLYGHTVPTGTGHPDIFDWATTEIEENRLGLGNWPAVDIVHDVLLLLAAGLIAVYVSDWMGRRRAKFSETLARLSERWHVVALCVAAMAAIMFSVRDAFDMLTSWYFNVDVNAVDPTFLVMLDVIRPFWSIVISFAELLALVLGISIVASAVLDEGSVGESFIEGLVASLNRRSWFRTMLFTAAFVVLYRIASWASIGATLVLNATHSPLLDTFVYVAVYALPTAFVVMTTVTSYVDLTELPAP
ncbi:MAG TPA: hypothetical protein VFO25_11260 [Candidatus Eremiobacteraceae bacterium]|nr:hypothetical protein [Candidatus Eremiobacteraceae bacterium]